MNVVVCATPIVGHVRPMMQVAEHLLGRGHDVTLVTAPEFAPDAAARGLPLHALEQDVGGWLARRAELPPGFEQLNLDFTELYARPVAAQHRALQRVVTQETVLLADAGYTGAWPVLLGAGGVRPALAIGVGVTPVAAISDDTAALSGPVPGGPVPGDPETARQAHRAANEQLVAALAPSQDRIESALRDCGATQPVSFFLNAAYEVWDVAAQLCVPEFEFPRSDAPPGLRFVGPLPVPASGGAPLPGWWPELTGGREVVLVTQGTVSNVDTDQVIAPAVEALAGTDVLVVVALGRDPSTFGTGALPGNVRVGGFLPYDRLLPHVSVVVTNGGYGGTQQALRHGVPLVVAGAGDDKAFVAARVAACGAGIDLGTGRPTPEQVRSAVHTVRSTPDHRANALLMADHIGRTDALAAIEEMVRGAR